MKSPKKSKYWTPPKPRGLDDVVVELVAFVHEYLEKFMEPIPLGALYRRFYSSVYHYGGHLPDVLKILESEGKVRVILQHNGTRIVAPGVGRPGPTPPAAPSV